MRTVSFLVAAVVATIWYGGRCVLGGLFGVPWHKGGLYDRMQRHWARSILAAAGVVVTCEGGEHLALDLPQIVASNHASFFDILALLGYLPVDAKFIAKKQIFRIPVLGRAMLAAGHVPMDRGHQKQAFGAYEVATARMKERALTIVVYPEGTRTRTGEMLPFKKGPFVFAIGSGVPIVPCYVTGAFGIQPKGSIRVRPQPVHITLGPGIPTTGVDMDAREELADRAREAMLALKSRVDAARAPA